MIAATGAKKHPAPMNDAARVAVRIKLLIDPTTATTPSARASVSRARWILIALTALTTRAMTRPVPRVDVRSRIPAIDMPIMIMRSGGASLSSHSRLTEYLY
jgi:hypothetical protein